MNPFPIDAEVMAAIRPMRCGDAPEVARLHQADMGRSLWGRLGVGFLEALYEALTRSPCFIGFVYADADGVGGFIAGTEDSARLFADVLRRAGLRLAWRALLGVARAPGLIPEVAETALYFRRSRPAGDVRPESLFCSFVPHLRGRRISGHVNKVLFDELRARGHHQVKITTEADNDAAVRQLTSWGFANRGAFRFYGKQMLIFVLDLAACERVEPVSRFRQDGPVRSRN